MLRDLLTVLIAFALGTLVAELAGAVNLGVSFTFGTFAFVGVMLWILLGRPGPGRA